MKKAKVISVILVTAIVLVLFPYSVFAASAPTLQLAEDTGVSGDYITSNGQMNVGGLEAGATWEYSVNNGANWSAGAGTSFVLSDGTYPVGTVQVRQTVDGSTSAVASNTSEIVIAQNQIYNGDFQDGYAGFTSEYSYLGECQTEGTYAVVTHANEVHPAFSIVYDHTYGTSSGKYFVANGALVPGQTLWQSTSPITVEAGVAYRFEAYLMSLTADTNGFPRVRFQIGDGTTWADLGTTNVAWVIGEKNIWHSIYADGQFNTAGTYYIRLLNDQTQQYNDLGVDDIYFGLRGAAPTASDPGTNPTNPPATFDTSAMLSMELASDTGLSDSDKITSNGQVNVTGLQYAWQYSINGGSWTTGSGSSFTVTGDGDKSVTVRQQNASAVWQPASAPLEFTLDTTAPTVSISSSESSPTNAVPIPVTVTFSEDVTGSALGDITVGNGTVSNLLGSGAVYTADITPLADGTVTVDVPGAVVQDLAGNGNTAATQFSIVSDTVPPVITITSTETSPTNTALIPFTITTNESTSSITVQFVNGTYDHDTFTGNTWVIYVEPTADGPVGLIVEAGDAIDLAGNSNTEDVQLSIVSDTTAPTVTITSNESDPTNAVSIPVTITFSEAVTGFDVSDITVGNGSADNFSGSGTTYTADITPSADGTVTADIAADAAIDVAGNGNTAAAQLSIVSDTLAPTGTSISINGGDSYTNSTSVTLTLGATGASEMIISENSDFSGASYEAYSASKSFTLSSTDGTKTVYVKYKDAAGNESEAVSDTIELDTVHPTVTITSSESDPTNAVPIPVTITFSEAVTGFDISDITVGNGSAGNFSGSGTTYTADITPSADGTVTVDIAADAAIDVAGNGNTAAAQFSIVSDTLAPTVTITTSESDPTKAVPIPVTITFSEDVTGFDVSDITVGNGGAGSFSGSGTIYTADITPDADGTVTVDIAADAAVDDADNGNTAATQLSIVSDTTAPTVTITTSESDPTNAVPIPVTITFSEGVTGFDISDITVGNGSAGSFSGSGATYTVDITPTADGTVTVDIAADAAVDAADNGNTAAAQMSIVSDTTAPTVTITTAESDPTNAVPIPVTITFSEDVTDFNISDITVGNGSAGSFSGSGTTYTADITPDADGTVTVDIAADAAIDDADNGNMAATQLSIVSDTLAPTVTITTAESDPTNTVPIPVTITFSEDVTGFDVSDITVGNGSAGSFSGSGTTYTADITPDADGTVTVDIAADAAVDDADNGNTAAEQLSIVHDTTAPTVTITTLESDPTNAVPIPVTITFSEEVTDFDVSDITVGNGSAGSFSGSGTTYTADITPTADGTVTVDIAADAAIDMADNASTVATQFSIVSDTLAPTDGSILINKGKTYTYSRYVTLTLSATGASEMMVSEDENFDGESYRTYSDSLVFKLSSGYGTKTVYVKYKDEAGNVTTETISDAIKYTYVPDDPDEDEPDDSEGADASDDSSGDDAQNEDDQSDDDQQNGEDDQQNEDGDDQEGSAGEGSEDQGGSGALGIISGYLVDTQGNPLTGVLVELHSDPMQTYTDDEGFFLFENVEPGEHTIFIIDERLDSAYSTKVEFIKDDSGQPQMQEYKNDLQKDGIPVELEGITKLEIYFVVQEAEASAFAWQWLLIIPAAAIVILLIFFIRRRRQDEEEAGSY